MEQLTPTACCIHEDLREGIITVCTLNDCHRPRYIVPLRDGQVTALNVSLEEDGCYAMRMRLTSEQVAATRPAIEDVVNTVKHVTKLALMRLTGEELVGLKTKVESVLEDV